MKKAAKNAFLLGGICTAAYMFVYFVRNILSVVTPYIIKSGKYTETDIGKFSSIFFIVYAIGQLINGILGDKIKAKYMISFGLIFAGMTNIVFYFDDISFTVSYIAYALCGFFLSMIYGPMTKLVAENLTPIYASRSAIAYNFSSHLGAPIAGIVAVLLSWQLVFFTGGITLIVVGIACYIIFTYLEAIGMINYQGAIKAKNNLAEGIKSLFKRKIVKFTAIAFLTGIIRTAVVFWLPTYYNDYLHFSENKSSIIFTITTLATSLNALLAITIYEKLNRNLDYTLVLSFATSAVFFALCIVIKEPYTNIVIINLAIFFANCASTMLWSRYCPGLRSTGLVSSATGFLDFISYMAASISTSLFSNAVSSIGWTWLIVIWSALMLLGIAVSIPYDKNTHYLDE